MHRLASRKDRGLKACEPCDHPNRRSGKQGSDKQAVDVKRIGPRHAFVSEALHVGLADPDEQAAIGFFICGPDCNATILPEMDAPTNGANGRPLSSRAAKLRLTVTVSTIASALQMLICQGRRLSSCTM